SRSPQTVPKAPPAPSRGSPSPRVDGEGRPVEGPAGDSSPPRGRHAGTPDKTSGVTRSGSGNSGHGPAKSKREGSTDHSPVLKSRQQAAVSSPPAREDEERAGAHWAQPDPEAREVVVTEEPLYPQAPEVAQEERVARPHRLVILFITADQGVTKEEPIVTAPEVISKEERIAEEEPDAKAPEVIAKEEFITKAP
ncbi:hypothetical protein chiPu_0027224, partial [Chiloscyllium punctatum]|nr:hypothetical protein [Chiloscyllium punctatum]